MPLEMNRHAHLFTVRDPAYIIAFATVQIALCAYHFVGYDIDRLCRPARTDVGDAGRAVISSHRHIRLYTAACVNILDSLLLFGPYWYWRLFLAGTWSRTCLPLHFMFISIIALY